MMNTFHFIGLVGGAGAPEIMGTTPRRLGGRTGIEALGCAEKDCRKAAPKEEQGGNLANQTAARQPEGRIEALWNLRGQALILDI